MTLHASNITAAISRVVGSELDRAILANLSYNHPYATSAISTA
jgi:hypothetical protein